MLNIIAIDQCGFRYSIKKFFLKITTVIIVKISSEIICKEECVK